MDMVAFCAAKRNTTVPSVKRIYASCPASRSTMSGSTTRQPPRAPVRARSTRAPAAAAARELHTLRLVLQVGFTRKPSRYKRSRALTKHLYLWHDEPFRNGRLSNLLFIARGQCAGGTHRACIDVVVRRLHFSSCIEIFNCHSPTVLGQESNTRADHAHRSAAKFVLYLRQLHAVM